MLLSPLERLPDDVFPSIAVYLKDRDIVCLRNASRATRAVSVLPSVRRRLNARLAVLSGDAAWYSRALSQIGRVCQWFKTHRPRSSHADLMGTLVDQVSRLICMQINDETLLWTTLAAYIYQCGLQMTAIRITKLVLAHMQPRSAWAVPLMVKLGASDPAFTFDLVLTDTMTEPERICTVAAALAATGNAFAGSVEERLLTKLRHPNWSAEWAAFLINTCLVPPLTPETAQLVEFALNELSVSFELLAHTALVPPTLRDDVVAAIVRSFDAGTCAKYGSAAAALARTLTRVLRTSFSNSDLEIDCQEEQVEYPISGNYDDGKYELAFGWPEEMTALEAEDMVKSNNLQAARARGLMPYLMALATCEHDKAVEYAVLAIGRILGWPTRAVADVALDAGAHTLLLRMYQKSETLSRRVRCATLAALAAWAAADHNTELLVDDPELVPHLVSLITTETDHLALQVTYALLKSLVVRAPTLDSSLIDQLMSLAASTTVYCDEDMHCMCKIRREQLQLMANIATAASKLRRFDLLVLLADRGLGPWMARAQDFEIVPEYHFTEFEPILLVLHAYQLSGVESDPVWGERDKIQRWFDVAIGDYLVEMWHESEFADPRVKQLLADVRRGLGYLEI
ncbi:hypothetical protein BC828DRAFT_385756 [Blastocladiella britannica]|nr:hypothetical protein BC828DRAFT_385756 [Blastocladiella britannica]